MTSYILVVDDDEAIQAFVSMSLSNEGYEVRLASDGKEAVHALQAEPPALILLDMRMPNMNGRDFVRAYRQTPAPHAPIIVMTAGRSTDETMGDMQIAGFLAKPFDLNNLLDLIEQHLKQR